MLKALFVGHTFWTKQKVFRQSYTVAANLQEVSNLNGIASP